MLLQSAARYEGGDVFVASLMHFACQGDTLVI
jgi:hypothetical protein